jgi:hypothetical protein
LEEWTYENFVESGSVFCICGGSNMAHVSLSHSSPKSQDVGAACALQLARKCVIKIILINIFLFFKIYF